MVVAPKHLQVLREMYDQAGQARPYRDRVRMRSALRALVRANSRLPAPQDVHLTEAADRHGWGQVIDHGVAEVWAGQELDGFIDRLGLEEVAPGLKSVEAPPEYPREAAAMDGLTASLAKHWRWGEDAVRRELVQRPPYERIEYVAELLYKQRRLQFLVPDHSEHVSRLAVENALRDNLDQVALADDDGAAKALGEKAFSDAWAQVVSLNAQYDNPALVKLLTKDAAQAALKIGGAEKSAQNGRVDEPGELPGGNGVLLGVATWRGELLLHDPLVVQPLREMYANSGEQHDEATLRRYRSALATLLHENTHFAIPQDETYSDSARIFSERRWVQWGEEGFTNAYTDKRLNDFITELGIDKVAPGITEVDHRGTYPEFTPAALAVAEGIDRYAGTPPEALELINREAPAGKWERITDLLYDASRLPQLVPPTEVLPVKRSIERAMRTNFAWLDENTGKGTEAQTEAMSGLRGRQSLAAGQHQIATLETQYSSPDSKALVQALRAAHAGMTPPSTSSSVEVRSRPGAPSQPLRRSPPSATRD